MSDAAGRVRLLATDLDGTLLRSDGTVSDRTRAALHRAADAGLLIAYATGRPPRWLHDIAEATGYTGIAVAANGAVLYDLTTETVIAEHVLSTELLLDITATLRDAFPKILFAVEYGDNPTRSAAPFGTFGYEPGYIHDWEISPARDRQGRQIPPPLVAELTTVISQGGVKLLAKDREADIDGFMEAATELLAGRATVTHSSLGLIEIGAVGITKASGVAYLADLYSIAQADVAAVGDMPNDIPMLEWAGRSYAMGNAHPTVLAVAQHHLAATNNEDAVADLIDDLLA